MKRMQRIKAQTIFINEPKPVLMNELYVATAIIAAIIKQLIRKNKLVWYILFIIYYYT